MEYSHSVLYTDDDTSIFVIFPKNKKEKDASVQINSGRVDVSLNNLRKIVFAIDIDAEMEVDQFWEEEDGWLRYGNNRLSLQCRDSVGSIQTCIDLENGHLRELRNFIDAHLVSRGL